MAAAENNDTPSPFGRTWIISGALVLLAVALTAFMIVRGLTGGEEPAAEPTPSPSASAAAAPGATESARPAGQCATLNTTKKDRGIPGEAPAVAWERHPSGGVVPVSAKHGPMQRDGEFWHCTSRTASGALVAGMSLVYDFATGDKTAASDGPTRDEKFSRSQYGPNTEFGTVEGYRVLLATSDNAEVEYLLSIKGKNAVMRVPMVWDATRNDWLLDSSSNDLGVTVVEESTGFTSWR